MSFINIVNTNYEKLSSKYPSFNSPTKEKYGYSFEGEIELIDPIDGKIWDTYNVKILLPFGYPKSTPKLYEIGGKIEKDEDYHINGDGSCCLAPRLEEVLILGKDYTLVDFVDKLVIKFLAEQKLKSLGEDWVNGEYSHYGQGLVEYYTKKLSLENKDEVILALQILSNIKTSYTRNDSCLCGSSKKYKNCHLKIFRSLMIIDNSIFIQDLNEIKRSYN